MSEIGKCGFFSSLDFQIDRMGAGRKQQNKNPHCFRFLKLYEYFFLECVEKHDKGHLLCKKGKRKISVRGLLKVYYDAFSYS